MDSEKVIGAVWRIAVLNFLLAVIFLLAIATSSLFADDLALKDGSTISGNIVGFENGMFRLETEFGFVLVRKDKVASIQVSEGAAKVVSRKTDQSKRPNGAAENAGGKSEEHLQPGSTGKKTDSNPSAVSPSNAAETNTPPARLVDAMPKPPPPAVSHLVNVPLPARIDQHEEGNNYFNDTFHFAMYKPPGWKIYDELPRGKVSAIVALASEDEQTLLFVDRQVWSGTPDLKNDSVEANLRDIYQNFQKLSEADTQIDGRPAIRHTFSGVMDGAEWHGVVVRLAEGSTVYGIVGMTSAESFQFQEALINKILKSFHFIAATSETPASSRASSAQGKP